MRAPPVICAAMAARARHTTAGSATWHQRALLIGEMGAGEAGAAGDENFPAHTGNLVDAAASRH